MAMNTALIKITTNILSAIDVSNPNPDPSAAFDITDITLIHSFDWFVTSFW